MQILSKIYFFARHLKQISSSVSFVYGINITRTFRPKHFGNSERLIDITRGPRRQSFGFKSHKTTNKVEVCLRILTNVNKLFQDLFANHNVLKLIVFFNVVIVLTPNECLQKFQDENFS